jgi:hypothetical protein
LALDPTKKEAEVKKERKQLFQYAINHRRYDWVEELAKLQLQRAILFLKELRADGREYEKQLRLGNKSKTLQIIQKYGVNFTVNDGVSGLMLSLYHGQTELAAELLSKGASITQTDNADRLASDYLMDGYITGKRQKQKQGQVANDKALISFWEKIKPQAIVYEYKDRQFRIGSHSMLFFLMILMRNTEKYQDKRAHSKVDESKTFGAFDMSDLEQLAAIIPDEILPLYRKRRGYINSIMASNEVTKDSSYCKSAFIRVARGFYILNPEIVSVRSE